MEQNLLNLNANFAVILLNGFAGISSINIKIIQFRITNTFDD